MQANYNPPKKGQEHMGEVEITLGGTPVIEDKNTESDDTKMIAYGSTYLTAYGARQLAYQLLHAANDADHYRDKYR